MSYLAPASFHFVRGIIGITKGSDIANLASIRGSKRPMLAIVKFSITKPALQKGCEKIL